MQPFDSDRMLATIEIYGEYESMKAAQDPRVQALRNVLQEEMHGLWISDEMAVKILDCVDKATSGTSNFAPHKEASVTQMKPGA